MTPEEYYNNLKRLGLFKRTYEFEAGLITYSSYLVLFKELVAKELIASISDSSTIRVQSSILTPRQYLVQSGHLENFLASYTNCKICNKRVGEKETNCTSCGANLSFDEPPSSEMYQVLDSDYFLRPETCIPLFRNYKYYKYFHNSSEVLGLIQRGYSFRKDISSNKKLVRLKEFEQIQLELFIRMNKKEVSSLVNSSLRIKLNNLVQFVSIKDIINSTNFSNERCAVQFSVYMSRLAEFLNKLNLNWYIEPIPKEDLPHYGVCAFDIIVDTGEAQHELSTICDRGNYDLQFDLSESELGIVKVLEFSIGLDRLVYCILKSTWGIANRIPDFINPWLLYVIDERNDRPANIFSKLSSENQVQYYSKVETGCSPSKTTMQTIEKFGKCLMVVSESSYSLRDFAVDSSIDQELVAKVIRILGLKEAQ